MSSRDTIRDSPLSKTAPGEPSDDDAAGEAPRDVSADAEKIFDPYRFQANTMPPGLREEILAAKPAPVPEGRFEDTVPPNVVIGERRDDEDERSTTPEESRPVDGRSDPTLIVRRSRRASSTPWIVGAGAAIVAFAVIVLLAAPRTNSESATGTPRAVHEPDSPTTSGASTPQQTLGGNNPSSAAATIASPTAVDSTPAREPPKPTASKRHPERVAGVGVHEKSNRTSAAAPQPSPSAGTRAGAFATPLAPPDK